MRMATVAVFGLATLAACSDKVEPTGASTVAALATVDASAAPSAAAVPLATARKEELKNDLIDFAYSYPAAAAAIPALKARFDADLESQKADLIKEAKAGQKEAKENDFPFNGFGYWRSWQTVADLPGWLSLSAEIGTYEGGAHPNHEYDSLIWDRQAGQARDPADMFTSKSALSAVIKADFCKAIDLQRKEKRGEDWKMGGEFDECIDPLDNGTLILGSSNHMAFDRIGILVPPYAAGPYAEGDYEVTLPVSKAILAAVKPEFRSTFVVKR